MGLANGASNIARPSADGAVLQRLELLRGNELNLTVELRNTADEIETRTARIAVVLALLRDTRRERAALEDRTPGW